MDQHNAVQDGSGSVQAGLPRPAPLPSATIPPSAAPLSSDSQPGAPQQDAPNSGIPTPENDLGQSEPAGSEKLPPRKHPREVQLVQDIPYEIDKRTPGLLVRPCVTLLFLHGNGREIGREWSEPLAEHGLGKRDVLMKPIFGWCKQHEAWVSVLPITFSSPLGLISASGEEPHAMQQHITYPAPGFEYYRVTRVKNPLAGNLNQTVATFLIEAPGPQAPQGNGSDAAHFPGWLPPQRLSLGQLVQGQLLLDQPPNHGHAPPNHHPLGQIGLPNAPGTRILAHQVPQQQPLPNQSLPTQALPNQALPDQHLSSQTLHGQVPPTQPFQRQPPPQEQSLLNQPDTPVNQQQGGDQAGSETLSPNLDLMGGMQGMQNVLPPDQQAVDQKLNSMDGLQYVQNFLQSGQQQGIYENGSDDLSTTPDLMGGTQDIQGSLPPVQQQVVHQ